MSKLSYVLIAGVAALGFSGAAQAADLMVQTPAPEAPMVSAPAGGNWDGPYIGIFGGFGRGFADHDNSDVGSGPCAPNGCDIDLSGAILGVDAGANFYLSDKIVGGIAGDIAWTNISGEDDNLNYPIDWSSNSIDWQGSIRGVLGLDAGAIMPYVTGGLAFAQGHHESGAYDNGFGTSGSADATHIGWTAGLGVAIAATENVSVDLQYRHNDFGDQTYDEGAGSYNPDFTLTSDQITVGLHLKM